MVGFNVGSKLSLGDMDLAIEYLSSRGTIKNEVDISSFQRPKIRDGAVKAVIEIKEPKIEEVKESEGEKIRRELELEKRRFQEEQDLEKVRMMEELKAERDRMENDRLELEEFKRIEREKLQREFEEEKRKLEEEKRRVLEARIHREELERIRAAEDARKREVKAVQEKPKTLEVENMNLPKIDYERPEAKAVSNQSRYEGMEIETLYKEVKKFMQAHGVEKNAVDKGLIEEEFGVKNIKNLIARSYLIVMRKGVTVGR